MRVFDYLNLPATFLTPEIVGMMTRIHEYKGRQALFIEAHADALTTLMEVAKIQSTGASNRIEGINTSDKRLRELMQRKSEPRSRSEQEIIGYRDVLATIHESFDAIPLRPGVIMQLHRQLLSYTQYSDGGSYKRTDNSIIEKSADGEEIVRFTPVPAYLTTNAMELLCKEFQESYERKKHDALLLIPMVVLDFLCIHPFRDGNGRMSRLLTLLLFYQSGYIVGKYISLEMLIESSKGTYYDALFDSSTGWHTNESDYLPFIRYYLGVLIKAYSEFESRVDYLVQSNISKPNRIKAVIDRSLGKITKAEIMAACPDISNVTVERTLTALVKEGYLVKVGAGPSTAYRKAI